MGRNAISTGLTENNIIIKKGNPEVLNYRKSIFQSGIYHYTSSSESKYLMYSNIYIF